MWPTDERKTHIYKGLVSLAVMWLIMGTALYLWWGPGMWMLAAGLILFTGFSLNDDYKDYQKLKPKLIPSELSKEEKEYRAWCKPETNEEKILQKLADGLLEIYDWNRLPPIKVRLNPDMDNEEPSAHYKHGFIHHRKPGGQAIEFKPSYYHKASIEELKSTMKHELIHAWVEWLGFGEEINKGHGPYFIWKSIEIGDESEIAGTLHHYPDTRFIYDQMKTKGDAYNSIKASVEAVKSDRG
jgi:hypothetical protein